MRTIHAMKRLHGKYFDFHPEGFILPREREAFSRYVSTEIQASKSRSLSVDAGARLADGVRRPSSASLLSSGDTTAMNSANSSGKGIGGSLNANSRGGRPSLWIVKPVASSCGKGISVMTSAQAAAIPKRRKVIVQKYLDDPYLIDGKKFDLRLVEIGKYHYLSFISLKLFHIVFSIQSK